MANDYNEQTINPLYLLLSHCIRQNQEKISTTVITIR